MISSQASDLGSPNSSLYSPVLSTSGGYKGEGLLSRKLFEDAASTPQSWVTADVASDVVRGFVFNFEI